MHLSVATYKSHRFQIPLGQELLMVKSHLVWMLGTELGALCNSSVYWPLLSYLSSPRSRF